jgi:prevent-host-death family protein
MMIITSTEAQNNFGKYLRLVEEEDIVITKNGKKVARLVKFYENADSMIREGSSAYSHEGMRVTYEEFLKIARESENRYEYIDGQIYLLASPKFRHQRTVLELSVRFSSWFKDKACQPLTAPFDVTLYKEGKPNVVQPDLLVICDQDKINEDGTYTGTPTLVVEVLSESTRSKDLVIKLKLYMQSGVEEYWAVNPFSEEISIYRFAEREIEKVKTFKKGEQAGSFRFPGLAVVVDEIFG